MVEEQLAQLSAAVEAALSADGPVELAPLRTLDGGRSGITLVAEVTGRPTVDCVVVKAVPFGRPPVGRHDVLRQARVLAALADTPGVVVPRVLVTGTSPVHFYAMTRCPGEAVEPVLDAATVHLPAEVVRGRAENAADMLAALHRASVPFDADGTAEPVADLASEVARWRVTGEAADPQILVGGRQLADLLAAAQPHIEVKSVLVHGDFRLGNLVFDGVRPTGLIDWEIWGRTHPGVDLGWFLVFCDADLFPGIGKPVAGLPTGRELLDRYVAAGGTEPQELAWFEAFGRFKMAAIMAHNLRRHREGRHLDPFQEKLPPTIARLVETGIEKLRG
jgi:aminoglycoside phosphotransferase (APT) family kinase protein